MEKKYYYVSSVYTNMYKKGQGAVYYTADVTDNLEEYLLDCTPDDTSKAVILSVIEVSKKVYDHYRIICEVMIGAN